VYSNFAFYNGTALGDALADYVDFGHGVVVAVFSLTTFFANSYLGGRFLGDLQNTYYVISPGERILGPQLSLQFVDFSHPLLKDVKSLDGGVYSARSGGKLITDAHSVAVWSDLSPLIGTRLINGARRVDLNFFPPSSDVRPVYWSSITDGAKIIANALQYVSEAPCVGFSDCGSCTTNACQWCADTLQCTAEDFSCRNRVSRPGDCPAPACHQFTKCSTCIATDVLGACSWCLDNATCVPQTTNCKGEYNDPKYCSSLWI